jgi:ribosome-binding factor A
MQSQKQHQINALLARLAAEYIHATASKISMITVTHADVSPDAKNATIYVSVLPESSEHSALDFLRRSRADIREYIKQNTKLRVLPFIDIELDYGEKNRQRVQELSQNNK